MPFEYKELLYRYEFDFFNTADGLYVEITSFPLDQDNSWTTTGLPIKNNEIVRIEDNISALHLTQEAIDYINRIWRLRAFW
jgi:hypothetical protein